MANNSSLYDQILQLSDCLNCVSYLYRSFVFFPPEITPVWSRNNNYYVKNDTTVKSYERARNNFIYRIRIMRTNAGKIYHSLKARSNMYSAATFFTVWLSSFLDP